jgi:putative transposase
MCRVLSIQRSGYYAWLKKPLSDRAIEDQRLLAPIKQFWSESGYAYGYRNITLDLKDQGESCGKNRVHRIMKNAGIRSQRGYKRHPGFKGGKVSHVAPNALDRQFEVDQPNQAWVTDFTYVRTHEGWLYVTIVMDLFSRQVIGWSMKRNPRSDLVLDALLMAVWRRKPDQRVMVHSDQGIQYTCSDWRKFLDDHNLEASMSRRGNCHDNAVAESFFSLLKMERIKRRIYPTRQEARADIFDYIEGFYNRRRRHSNNQGVSPEQFEISYLEKLSAV